MPRETRGTRRYTKEQIRNMKIDPYTVGSIFTAYPHLQTLFENPPEGLPQPSINKEHFMQWVSFVYDPASPVAKEHAGNQQAAFDRAADEVGCKITYFRENYLYVIRRFLQQVVRSQEWAEIVTLDNLFWEYQRHLSEPVKDGSEDERLKAVERQGKMSEQMSKFRERAAALRKILYGEDKELATEDSEDYSPEGQNRLKRERQNKP